MSGGHAPSLPLADARGLTVGVVAAQWHEQITDALLAGALRALKEADVPDPVILRVPGSFELPVGAAALAQRGCDAIVALGVVVRGETPHFDYVCQGATTGLTQLAVTTGVPVGFGLLTCDTEEQAYERSGLPGSREDKGYEAAQAALATALAIRTGPNGLK